MDEIEIHRAAAMLGRIGGAKKKNYSEEERQRRRDRLAIYRARRWTAVAEKEVRNDGIQA